MKALIQDGAVVGFVTGDAMGERLPEGLPVGVGWRFDRGVFVAPVDAPRPDRAPLVERAWRDGELAQWLWLRDRHRDQLDQAGDTTLTSEQFSALLIYLQALRDWPQSNAFPDLSARPVPPIFLEKMRMDQ